MNPVQFLKEVKEELNKVTWPTTEEVFEGTVGVIVFTAFIAAYFWILDMFFTQIMQFILNQGV